MRLSTVTAMLTGATGGIGRAIATELLAGGAAVLLVSRDEAALQQLTEELRSYGPRVATHRADITQPADRERLCDFAMHWRSGVNMLINNAGVCDFLLIEDQPPEQISAAFAINVEAPIHLCQMMLPHLRSQPSATIVNVGSVFGAIGYPGYTLYSATKFALRGFTEALRRELAATPVRVHYLAPRATATPMNSLAVNRMNADLKVAIDAPSIVSRALRELIEEQQSETVIGWPEKLFCRINAVLPRMVDNAIRKQLPVIRRYASENAK